MSDDLVKAREQRDSLAKKLDEWTAEDAAKDARIEELEAENKRLQNELDRIADIYDSEDKRLDFEFKALEAEKERYRVALSKIKGAHFVGAASMAMTGNWKGIVIASQQCARAALETEAE